MQSKLIHTPFFKEIGKNIREFIWKIKRPQRTVAILDKKNDTRVIATPDDGYIPKL